MYALLLRALDIPCAPLHSILSQSERLATLAKFRAGKVRVLVATDVASRFGGCGHCVGGDVPCFVCSTCDCIELLLLTVFNCSITFCFLKHFFVMSEITQLVSVHSIVCQL